MKKRNIVIALVLICVFLFTACSKSVNVTLELASGKSVSLPLDLTALSRDSVVSGMSTQINKLLFTLSKEGTCQIETNVEDVGRVIFTVVYEKGKVTVTSEPAVDFKVTTK